jgi:hypothetical protein
MEQISQDLLEGGPLSGLTVYELDEEDDDAPEGAVCKTATQYLNAEGQPLNPPPGH